MSDLANLDWVSLGLTLVGLAVVWFLVRTVLKLTARLFACGCAVIGGLALAAFVLLNWNQVTAWLGL
ncbi:MAG: hypothetical protein JNK29_06120 [Anaerolineales bacterium]|nr:hypothetical protein [Anaerolineales bacterium]